MTYALTLRYETETLEEASDLADVLVEWAAELLGSLFIDADFSPDGVDGFDSRPGTG